MVWCSYALIDMTIPIWQCFPWAQYSHIGVVLLTIMVYVGTVIEVGSTGINPEKTSLFGAHGAAKVDDVTVWLFGANWNCTISPTAAVTWLGENVSVLLAPPTLTTQTLVDPEVLVDDDDEVPVDSEDAADNTPDDARVFVIITLLIS